MKINALFMRQWKPIFFLLMSSAIFFSFAPLSIFTNTRSVSFPWKQAGLNERQAAAHLLSRFTWGATTEQVDEVVKTGLEQWFTQQLDATGEEKKISSLLSDNDAFRLSTPEIVSSYLRGGQIVKMAIADGVIPKDSAGKAGKKEYRALIDAYMEKKGIKAERTLQRQMINQKIVRALNTSDQLNDVLTDFWFNHFNVSFTKPNCGQFIPSFERDVIRRNATGNFETLLIATAQSPAMLMFLDNFTSTGTPAAPRNARQQKPAAKPKMKGLNENYAREVMELHTLGVDGGYTQKDVTEAARILTGWTILPMGNEGYGNGYQKLKEKLSAAQLSERGFVEKGEFLFTPNRHDEGEKIFLGKRFAPGGGYEEGIALLKMLAEHPSTAKFISRKIAVRFVSDEPPVALVDRMAKTFTESRGNIRSVLLTLVSSPEFWSSAAVREKTKSPFELLISSLRVMGAQVSDPYVLFTWINRMGQPLYAYQAPTGFPDRGQYWINTGSLLNRMNFGLAVADKRIKGVSFDVLAMNHNHEPESAENALVVYSALLMPERNTEETIKRLTPLLNDPELQTKVRKAAGVHGDVHVDKEMNRDSLREMAVIADKPIKQADKYRLSQVIGILLGSPEFQRR